MRVCNIEDFFRIELAQEGSVASWANLSSCDIGALVCHKTVGGLQTFNVVNI